MLLNNNESINQSMMLYGTVFIFSTYRIESLARLAGNGGRGGHPQNEVRKIQDILVPVGYLGEHPC